MKKIATAALATTVLGGILLSTAPAHADYSDRPLNLASTTTNPDVNFVWNGATGQFCVRVRNVNVLAGATIEKPNGESITFSASNGNPDCKTISFSRDRNATAYGYARNPGRDSGNTGYYPIAIS